MTIFTRKNNSDSKQDSRKPGIAIVSASGCAIDEPGVERGLQVLRDRGFEVHSYYQPDKKFQRFGGTDSQRAAQLHDAADNPDVDIIMALRGSYGLSRLLPHLDYKKLVASRKCFVGYSDFNALHLALLSQGHQASISGPMLCDDFSREDLSEFTLQSFFNCIKNTHHHVEFDTSASPECDVAGTLWGGNLAMLTHLAGTPYFPKIDNGILFVEDIAEHPYRVERMMLQLHFAGVLEQQSAIVFGDFSGYKLAAHDNGYNFEQMIQFLRETVKVPIITGLPFGHIKDKASLVIGSQASLLCQRGKVRLEMHYEF